jgi:CheY-like chemotaxis protein
METANKGFKILLIDDDKFLLEMYQTKLINCGFEVVAIQIPEKDVVSQVAEINPDLIISDYVRPKMDGIQTLRVLRKDKRTENIPFVFLSNTITEKHSSAEVLKEARDLGTIAFICKATTTPTDVVNTVSSLISKF